MQMRSRKRIGNHPQSVVVPIPMAIVAACRVIAIGPVQIVTFVADSLIVLKILMPIIISMIPAGPGRRLTPAGSEMALRAVCGQIVAGTAI